jgi:acyl-CoA synthetase (AMP-forming)/AMP-acid ligase II
MTGYFRDREATRKVLSDDGWFRTGDLGQIIDGQVIWLSRLKDIIRVSGENVAASEIEEVLLAAEPRIAEVAVVAGPDRRRGEVPIAFVRARESCAACLLTSRFREKCDSWTTFPERKRLSEFKKSNSARGCEMRHHASD